MKDRKSKIYAVDFDQTLSYGEYPACGEPNKKLIQYIKELQSQGNKIILWTCREGEALDMAVEWCANYGLFFDAVNDNLPEMIERFGNNCRKVYCDHYLDTSNYIPEYVTQKHEEEKKRKVARIY